MPARPASIGKQADLVFDVGAYCGEDSEFYLALGYRVVAIEAQPELAVALRERFSDAIRAGRYCVVERAIAEKAGEIELFTNSKYPGWATTDAAWARRYEHMGSTIGHVRIPAVRFAEVLAEHGMPAYLKIDIEGADSLCIAALEEFAERPDFLSSELDQTSWRKLVRDVRTLERLGYRRFKLVKQGDHGSGTFRSLSGDDVAFEFDSNSSGPFGRHLAGEWLTAGQALRRYRWIILGCKLFGAYTPLGRLFRKLPGLRRIPAMIGWYDTHAML